MKQHFKQFALSLFICGAISFLGVLLAAKGDIFKTFNFIVWAIFGV